MKHHALVRTHVYGFIHFAKNIVPIHGCLAMPASSRITSVPLCLCTMFSIIFLAMSAIVRNSAVSALHLEHVVLCHCTIPHARIGSRVKNGGGKRMSSVEWAPVMYLHAVCICTITISLQYNHERPPLIRSAIPQSIGDFIKPSFRFNYLEICQISSGHSAKSKITDSNVQMKSICPGKGTTRLFTFPKIR